MDEASPLPSNFQVPIDCLGIQKEQDLHAELCNGVGDSETKRNW